MANDQRPPNPRLTPKEKGLLKGALRRVFSRSELRRSVLDSQEVEHVDPNRPRVKRWCYCALCGVVSPRYLMSVDHILPIVKIEETFADMSLDEAVDRLWCEREGLQGLDDFCHSEKTKGENKLRREYKKKAKK